MLSSLVAGMAGSWRSWLKDQPTSAEAQKPAPPFWLAPRLAFVSLIVVVLAIGIVAYDVARHWVEDGIQRELSSAAQLKANQIERWLEERRTAADVIAASPLFVLGMRRWLDGVQDPELTAQLIAHLERLSAASHFAGICLRSAGSGAPLPITPCQTDSSRLRNLAVAAARQQAPQLEDFHRDQGRDATLEIGLFSPISLENGRPPELVAQISLDPSQSLFPSLQQWPGASPSAETLLVRRDGDDVLYLNTLRYRDDPPLTLRRPLAEKNLLAGLAIQGAVGLVRGQDYRKVASVGYLMPVAGTPWFLVAKMDSAEADAWLDRLTLATFLGVGLMLVIALWWWIERQHYVVAEYDRELAGAVLTDRMDFLSRNIHGCVLLIDLAGRILDTNDQCLDLYGYSVDETLALNGTALLRAVQPDGDLAALWQRLPRQGNLVCETEHARKDGSLVPVELSMRAATVFEAGCIQTIVRDIGERRRIEQDRQHQAARFAELSHRLVSIQEQERRRLSAELSDRTGANLAALDINLRSLARRLPATTDDQAVTLLADALALLADTGNGLHEVCADLRPAVLDYAGLPPALQSYTRQFSTRTGIRVELDCPELPVRLDSDLESTLFRIAQQALSNFARHADVERIWIRLEVRDDQVTMEIVDDGSGTATAEPDDGATTLELLSMSERAQFAGGGLYLARIPGRGTRILVTIPATFHPDHRMKMQMPAPAPFGVASAA